MTIPDALNVSIPLHSTNFNSSHTYKGHIPFVHEPLNNLNQNRYEMNLHSNDRQGGSGYVTLNAPHH
jgi:hypothetical protein